MQRHPPLSLKQVRAIEAVARCRGFAQAAQALNTTQPVVSRAVAAAETSLGAPLFQRGWGGAEPTARGEAVLRRCLNVQRLIAAAEEDIAALSGTRPNLGAFLSLHQLDAVAAVVRHGNASSAALELGITQPAVSRAIAAVARCCGQDLFARKPRGLDPGPPAFRLSALREALARELSDLPLAGTAQGQGLVGRLAVGMMPFSGQDLVARAFGELTKAHPDLRLAAVPGSYSMLVQALRSGEIDCIVGLLRNPAPFADLSETHLYSERFALVARSGHPCHREGLSIADLARERWIVAPHGTPVRAFFEGLFRTVGAVPPTQTCEILSFRHAEELILYSDSIALLTYSDERLAALPEGLRRLDLDLPDARTEIGLTFRTTGGSPDIVAAFEQALRNCLARA